MDVNIVCPVYKNIELFERLFNSFKEQKNINITKIVCPLTRSNKEIDDRIISFFEDNKITYFFVEKDDFSHSLTRQKAIEEYCDGRVVVMLSQDVILNDELTLFNLAKAVEENKSAYSYARQVGKKRTIEGYIREKNYPSKSITYYQKDIENMKIMSFFASDACSCYDRDIFMKLGGYQGYDLMMNEDQLYSEVVLLNGYNKMYVADSIVTHYHNYSLKELYNRYKQAGNFYAQVGWDKKYKINSSGFKLALYVFKRAICDFNIKVLFQFIPNMGARFLGMKKGKKHRHS